MADSFSNFVNVADPESARLIESEAERFGYGECGGTEKRFAQIAWAYRNTDHLSVLLQDPFLPKV